MYRKVGYQTYTFLLQRGCSDAGLLACPTVYSYAVHRGGLCVAEAGIELGYLSMKPQQLEVAVALVEGRRIFCPSSRILEKKKSLSPCSGIRQTSKEKKGLFHRCGCVMKDKVRSTVAF